MHAHEIIVSKIQRNWARRFSIFFENAFVSRVSCRMFIRMVKF